MTDSALDAPVTTRRDVLVLAGAAAWTLFVWSSRVGLAAADPSVTWLSWARIALSLTFGVVLVLLAVRSHTGTRSSWAAGVMVAFAGWMVVVWMPSLVSVLAGEYDAAFKLVHALLAIASLAVGTLVAGVARRETLFYPRATSTQAEASTTTR